MTNCHYEIKSVIALGVHWELVNDLEIKKRLQKWKDGHIMKDQ